MCDTCNDIPGGSTIEISEPTQPFCQDCGDGNQCVEKVDSNCVVYHLDHPEKPSKLDNLGLPNGASAEQIFEAIDDKIGNSFNVPLTVQDSDTIDLTASGSVNHNLKADVKISATAGNIIEAKTDGIYATAQDDGKVKVNATDVKDYLENQIIGGTDSIVSNSVIVESGQLKIQPSIDMVQLMAQLCANENFISCLLDRIEITTSLFDKLCAITSKCSCNIPVTNFTKAYAPACPTGYTLVNGVCTKVETTTPTIASTTVTACVSTDGEFGRYGAIVYTGGFTATGTGVGTTLSSDITAGNVVALPVNGTWANPSMTTTDGPVNRAGVWACGGIGTTGSTLGFSVPINITSTKQYYIAIAADDDFVLSVDGNNIADTTGIGNTYWNGDGGAMFRYWHVYPVILTAGIHYIGVSAADTGGVTSVVAAEIYDATLAELQAATLNPSYVADPSGFPLGQNHYANINLIFSTRCARQAGTTFSIGNATCPDSTWVLDVSGGNPLTPTCQGINSDTSLWSCTRTLTAAFPGYSVTLVWDKKSDALQYEVETKPASSPDSSYTGVAGSPFTQPVGAVGTTVVNAVTDPNQIFRIRAVSNSCSTPWAYASNA